MCNLTVQINETKCITVNKDSIKYTQDTQEKTTELTHLSNNEIIYS